MLRRCGLNDIALRDMEVATADEIAAHGPISRTVADVPTPAQLSRMEQALAWPLTYLRDHPREADALTIFAFAKATKGFDVRPFLQERLKQARALAGRMNRTFNERDPSQEENRRLRAEIIRQEMEGINARLALISSPDDAATVRQEGQWRVYQRCRDAACLPLSPYGPQDAAPGMVLSRSSLDRLRRIATRIIADGLDAHRVPVT